jgi:O-antigen/teichoic acid export membrane protein
MPDHIDHAPLQVGGVESASTTTPVIDAGGDAEARLNDLGSKDLKQRTTHGALVSLIAQATGLVLRTGSMMVLARLLLPADYGLVGMTVAFTGFLGLFRDAGLSMASVQRASITPVQTSTLFWVNAAVGLLLAGVCVAIAPMLAVFYHEPRLVWITIVSGVGYLFNGASTQHRAMMQRHMRFIALSVIDTVALILSIAVGIGSALAGAGYWALVLMAVTTPITSAMGVWVMGGWIPGLPQRQAGIGSMLWYGGTLTLNTVIVYFSYNLEKVLLGKFSGAETLGIYGRAYQLINLPTDSLHNTISSVAFPALSRVQDDPVRLRSYFLKGYALFLSLIIPLAMACALFANDIISVFLGAKWHASAPVFRLLAPTIVALAMVNPFGSLLLATGRVVRNFNLGLLVGPVVIVGYLIGIRYGPQGVAAGYSIAMVVLIVPVVLWAKCDLPITNMDILQTLKPPIVSALVGAAATLLLAVPMDHLHPVFLRLVIESAIFYGIFVVMLLFVMKERVMYFNILRETGLWPISALWQKMFRSRSAEAT